MPPLDLSIIIVSFNTKDYLKNCLDSIAASYPFQNFETIVVDNASQDGSTKLVKTDYPNVRLIEPGSNLGFAKANNLGAKYSFGRYLLFLNPDTLVTPTTFGSMVHFLDEKPGVGAATCLVHNENGTIQLLCTRRRPTIWVFLLDSLGINSRFPGNFIYKRYVMSDWNREEARPVDVISGAFYFIRCDLFSKLGGFDERYFMYVEDVDLSFRIWQSGSEVWFTPQAEIVHFSGKSSSTFSVLSTVRGIESYYRYFLHLGYSLFAIFYISFLMMIYFIASYLLIFFGIILDNNYLLIKGNSFNKVDLGLFFIKAKDE